MPRTKTSASQFVWDDTLTLTRNSIKEFQQVYVEPLKTKLRPTLNEKSVVKDAELDYPLTNVVNSFFPIDSVIRFNTTDEGEGHNITTHELIGRYASFSPILNYRLKSKYKILPSNACDLSELKSLDKKEYSKKILIVLRGSCTFVDKVSRLIESELDPKSIIIANDEPYRGLITMFSNTFNQDGSLRVPIMFLTNEDYKYLKKIQHQDLKLEISTAYIGSWMSIILSMVLSPPLLIIIFYAVIICGQKIRRRQLNKRNAKMVRSLPIYIYNIDHLISAKHFQHYLKVTGQANSVPKDSDLSGGGFFESPKPSPNGSTTSINKIIVGGIDLRSSKIPLHSITAPDDFYPSYKCSICLDKYIPLKSRVLVLECKHFFHEKCLSNWLINFKRSCPLCNYTLHSTYNTSHLLAGQEDSLDYGSMADLEAGPSSPFFDLTPSQVETIEEDSDEENYLLDPSLSRDSSHETQQEEEPTEETTDVISHPLEEVQPPPTMNAPQSMSSDASDLTFYTANSQPEEEGTSSPSPRKRPYLISKPSQILSRLTTTNSSPPGGELSASIDTGSDDKSTIESSSTSIVESDKADDSTINLSSSMH
ncbi:hypothetical protein SBY92_003884 [Candida maltosa Xu316]